MVGVKVIVGVNVSVGVKVNVGVSVSVGVEVNVGVSVQVSVAAGIVSVATGVCGAEDGRLHEASTKAIEIINKICFFISTPNITSSGMSH